MSRWMRCRPVPVRHLLDNDVPLGLEYRLERNGEPPMLQLWGNAARSNAPSQVSSSSRDQLQLQDGCPPGEGPTSNPDRRNGPRTEDLNTPPVRSALPAESNLTSASAAFPRGPTGGERINPQGQARATGTVPPRFLWQETSEKPDNAVIVSHPHASRIAPARVIAKIVHSG